MAALFVLQECRMLSFAKRLFEELADDLYRPGCEDVL